MEFTKTKAIVAGVGAVATAVTVTLMDNVFNASDAGTLVTVIIEQVLTVAAVFGFRNEVIPPVGE